jgi:hypothetical protein
LTLVIAIIVAVSIIGLFLGWLPSATAKATDSRNRMAQ